MTAYRNEELLRNEDTSRSAPRAQFLSSRKPRTAILPLLLAILALATAPISFGGPQRPPAVADSDVQVVTFEDMAYPSLAYNGRIQGMVTVQLKLDQQGRVSDATAISGHPLLIEGSVQNAKRWTFKPNWSKSAVLIYNYRILAGSCHEESKLFILQGANIATVLACPPKVKESSSDK